MIFTTVNFLILFFIGLGYTNETYQTRPEEEKLSTSPLRPNELNFTHSPLFIKNISSTNNGTIFTEDPSNYSLDENEMTEIFYINSSSSTYTSEITTETNKDIIQNFTDDNTIIKYVNTSNNGSSVLLRKDAFPRKYSNKNHHQNTSISTSTVATKTDSKININTNEIVIDSSKNNISKNNISNNISQKYHNNTSFLANFVKAINKNESNEKVNHSTTTDQETLNWLNVTGNVTNLKNVTANETTENVTEHGEFQNDEDAPIALAIMVPKRDPWGNYESNLKFNKHVEGNPQIGYMMAPESIKAYEISDLSVLSQVEIMNIPLGLWKKFNDTILNTMTKPQVQVVIPRLKAINETAMCIRILDGALKKSLSVQEYLEEANSLVATSLIKMKAILRPLIERLGSPAFWEPSVINELGFYSLYLPKDQLARLRNRNSIQLVIDMYERLLDASPRDPISALPKRNMSGTIRELLLTMYSNLSEWNEAIIKQNIRHLPLFSPVELTALNDNIILRIKDQLANVEFHDRAHAQPILRKIFSNTKFSKMSELLFIRFLNKLNLLEKYVSLTDIINPLDEVLTTINGQLIEHLKRHLATTDDAMLAQFLYELKNPSSWTTQGEVYKNAGRFLPFIGPDKIGRLAEQNLLNKQSLEQIGSGPSLEKGLILLLKDKIRENYFLEKTQKYHLGVLPVGFTSVVANDEIAAIDDTDIQRNIDKFNREASSLTSAQKSQVINKLIEKGFEVTGSHVHPAFMSLVSPKQLERLPPDRVELLLNDMSPESPQTQFYMQKKYQSTKLTLNDLRESPMLIGAMTTSMVQTLNPHDIFETLIIINESPISPRPKVIKYLASVLKEYLQNITGNNITDDVELLKSLTDSEMEMAGGQILAEFSTKALVQVPQERCSVLFSVIGRLTPDRLLNIQPPEKRNAIAKAAFECLDRKTDDEPLTMANVENLGYLMIYLSPQVLSLMDSSVFITALPYLQGISLEATTIDNSFNPFIPCFKNGMKAAIREKIIKEFGNPMNWTEATLWSVGCLLTTLESKDILDPGMLYQVKHIIISCSWAGNKGKGHRAWEELYREQCEKKTEPEDTNIITDGINDLEMQLTKAALKAPLQYAPLLTSSRRKREKFVSIGLQHDSQLILSCDGIRMSGGVINVASSELEKLDITKFEQCLDKLGEMPLTEEQASILWTQIKKSYGSNYPRNILFQLGRIALAMTPQEISQLQLKDLDVIANLGKVEGFTHEQLKALAQRAQLGIRSNGIQKLPSAYSSQDLISLGYILCGYHPLDVSEIPVKSYRDASVAIGYLHPCSEDVRNKLAMKAMDTYGESSLWSASTLSIIGSVVGGLPPEKLHAIPPEAFEGLTRAGARSLGPDSLRTLRTKQLSSFSVEGALSLTDQQMEELSKEQKTALKSVYIAPGDGSSKKGVLAKSVIVLFAFLLLLYHFHFSGL